MCAEIYRTGEPYELAGKRMVFTSWYYVRPCNFGWYDEKGNNVSVIGDLGPYDAHFGLFNHSWGIRLTTSAAQRTGPVLKEEFPWEEGGIGLTTLLKEKGIYRAWANTGWGDLKGRGKGYFCYLESQDGYDWKRPGCGIMEYDGNTHNNLLDIHGGTVFADPSAPEPERYKWISENSVTREEFEKYKESRANEVDWRSERIDVGMLFGVYGAVSQDGLHWKTLPLPLIMTHSDTQIVAYYDEFTKKYVAYFRDWMVGPQAEGVQDEKRMGWLAVGRRAVGMAETDNFSKFPMPQVIIEPSPDMSPSQVLYTNCKTVIPQAPDNHVMFPAVWDHANDTTSIVMYSSHNGRLWNKLSDAPVLCTAEFGQWDGGCIFASPNLTELSNGDFVLPYTGYNVPHKYPRAKAQRSTGYALWPKGRIAGLEAVDKGEFTTVLFIPQGQKIKINAVAKRAGYIYCEVLDSNLKPFSGRSFEEAVPVTGDNYGKPVRWMNHDNLGVEKGQSVALRFKMKEACIYAIDFED